MKIKSFASLSTLVFVLYFTNIAFATTHEATTNPTFKKELNKEHSEKSKTTLKEKLVKKFIQAKSYLAKKGIDLQDPTEKWLWYCIISYVVGGLFAIGGYIFYFIGVGTAVNNNGPNTSTLWAIVLAYFLLILASLLFLFANIALYIWIAKLVTDKPKTEEES